ncbi:MAG TPA: DUF559 domain-containing protein [Ktedonobacteraceae bacterium]|nr:DUF559 domain-containing protein [Ktedonobacteraceae bacterium]
MAYSRDHCDHILASAISYLIDGQEFYEASILLLCDLDMYEGWSSYEATDVTVELSGNRAVHEIIQDKNHAATTAITRALEAVLPRDTRLEYLTSRVAFNNMDSDWREKFLEIIQGKAALNQCKPIENKPRYTWEYLFFRSTYEIAIAKVLSEYDLLFLPNCMARFGKEGLNREADFLVCCDGKWGILEVDGEPYHENAAKDHDRDRLFQSHGIRVTQRYTVQRCTENPRGVVQEFLGLLKKNG